VLGKALKKENIIKMTLFLFYFWLVIWPSVGDMTDGLSCFEL